MNVIYFDPNVKFQPNLKINTLTELLHLSDIISIHVHLNEDTFHLINENNISDIKKGALIINTSRGKVVNEMALVEALKNGNIKGIASDVLYDEHSDIKANPLVKALNEGYNIILTPHIGGATWEAMSACEYYLSGE